MSRGQLVGRALFCVLLVISGVYKIHKPDEMAQSMVSKTRAFSYLVDTYPNTKPFNHMWNYYEFVQQNSIMILQVVGIVELITAAAIFFGKKYIGLIFSIALIPITLIMHNPLTSQDDQVFNDTVQLIKNLGFLGICIMMSVSSPVRRNYVEETESHSTETDKHKVSKGVKDSGKQQGKGKPRRD